MEVRMQPCTDDHQQCTQFQLHVRPATRTFSFQDHLGNIIHHFNIPGLHSELTIRAEAVVKLLPSPSLPQALEMDDWQRLDDMSLSHMLWEMRAPSRFTAPTPALAHLAAELEVGRRADPLTVLRELNTALNRLITYVPETTHVDSPIDDAILQRSGVCQDYAHIMLALVRNHLRIPCRYVSGYLYHRQADRSVAGATHAWVDVLLPHLGWVGFDPTNDLLVADRHIRTAVGRDYNDVPPTRGIFRGVADSELRVTVHVRTTEDVAPVDSGEETGSNGLLYPSSYTGISEWLQQQQQQQ